MAYNDVKRAQPRMICADITESRRPWLLYTFFVDCDINFIFRFDTVVIISMMTLHYHIKTKNFWRT